MLFRYKITKSCEWIGNIYQVYYYTKIQKYCPNNMIFKWETYEETTLKCITEILSEQCWLSGFQNGLQEIFDTITKYGSVDKMISEYIRKIIMRDIELKNDIDNIEKSLDEMIKTHGWKTIEIKEND